MKKINCLFLPIILLLGGCAHNTVSDSYSARIDSLKARDLPPLDSYSAIKRYKALLDQADAKNKKEYLSILLRLAELQMSTGENAQASTNKYIVEKGTKQIQAAIETLTNLAEIFRGKSSGDKIYYHLAKAYMLDQRYPESIRILGRLSDQYPSSPHLIEALFRRGEMLFDLKEYAKAEKEYIHIVELQTDTHFHEKSLYKLGWSRFKQGLFDESLQSYLSLLEFKEASGHIKVGGDYSEISSREQALIKDIIRAISLIYLYQGDDSSNRNELALLANQPYGPMLFRKISEVYLQKKMKTSAAQILLDFAGNNIYHSQAIEFHLDAINLLEQDDKPSLEVDAKVRFVKYFGIGSLIWQDLNEQRKNETLPKHIKYTRQLATYFHSLGDDIKSKRHYLLAAEWYRRYVQSFTERHDIPTMQFLLGEVLFAAGEYQQASVVYEKAAYEYPVNRNSADAGYAALLSYAKVLTENVKYEENSYLYKESVESALRFASKFGYDNRTSSVLLVAAQKLYKIDEYERAKDVANMLLTNLKDKSSNKIQEQRIIALKIVAHSQFQLAEFDKAETSYAHLLTLLTKTHKLYAEISARVVDSVYKHGEYYRNLGNYQLAAAEFMRVSTISVDPVTRSAAEYDAATMYLLLEDWNRAIFLLKDFKEKYPKNVKLAKGAEEKLVLAYSKTGQDLIAASKLIGLSELKEEERRKKDLLWEAAIRYDKAGELEKAALSYKSYIWEFPQPLDRSMEARQYMVEYYRKGKDTTKSDFWLKQIIKIDKKAGALRTERSKYLAAISSLELANAKYNKYQALKLKEPIKHSLRTKKKAMNAALAALEKAMEYKVEDVYITATYQIAEIYRNLATAMMEAKKPKGLNELEMEQYEIMLEEKTYPLEEKAMEIHKSNILHTKNHVFNEDIKKSLSVLSKLEPYRFNKMEITKPYVENMY